MKTFAVATLVCVLVSAAVAAPTATIHNNIPVIPNDEAGNMMKPADKKMPIVEFMDFQFLPAEKKVYMKTESFNANRQVRSEEAVRVFNSSESGNARTTRTGITVQIGTSGTLNFRVRARAVEAEVLSNSDSTFQSTLNETESEQYSLLKQSYSGGLNIPFLSFIGLNLNRRVEREDFQSSFETQRDYNTKATAASQILDNTVSQTIEISGTLTATGVSFIPTTVFSFIRIARIRFEDGTTMTVVSSDRNDVSAATPNGQRVPSTVDDFEILSF